MKRIAAALALAAPLCVAAQSIAFQRSGDIAWACGGVGSDERHALDTLRGEAQLELLLVTAQRGAYTSGTSVSVAPAHGGTPVTFVADGPTCLVQAPPGSYRIEGRYGATTRDASVRVAAKGKPARLVMSFPDPEPWNGIRASDEEKREAATP
jgi:hypothetical protein